MTKKYQTKINNFISVLNKSGVLNWTKKLQKKFLKSEIYLVGGAVRDALLCIPTKDYDFVVCGVPAKKLQNFLESSGWVELLGKNFGVFKFLPEGLKEKINPIDIALPRTEHSILNSGAYRDFNVQSNHKLKIEEDLSRRDFTINAMALKFEHWSTRPTRFASQSGRAGALDRFKLIDKFDGLSDLENKIIHTVGKPQTRFKEDYSRMLRAIRFACQLNFEIENNTKKNIKKNIKKINNVETFRRNVSTDVDAKKNPEKYNRASLHSQQNYIIPREIIAKEFLHALVENPARAFDLFDELGVFKILVPEVLKMKGCKQPENYHTEGDVWQHTRLCLKMLDSDLFKEQFKNPICLKKQETRNKKQINSNPAAAGQIPNSKLTYTKPYDSEVVLAVLLHDIEKPSCAAWVIKNGEKRLQFYGHDTEGAKTAKKICDRLRLSTPKEVGADCHNVAWLIKKHILLIHGKIDKMKSTKLEKYFLSPTHIGEKLLKVTFADAISTIQKGRKIPEKKSDLKDWIALQGFKIAIKRISEIKKLSKDKIQAPEPFLNGHEIMKILNLKPGYKIGKIKKQLRDAQLSGKITNEKEAREFIKLNIKNKI